MSIPIIAEVLDKEPSITSVWAFFLAVALIGYLVCWYLPWLIALVFPVALISAGIFASELFDPYVGPAIAAESKAYVIQCYVAMGLAVIMPWIGAVAKWRRRATL
jgi:CHASE2 domain-containing sensor protein